MARTRAEARYNLRPRNRPPAPINQLIECTICLSSILRNADYIRCANRCAAYFHRTCFERWCGQSCVCKGLLCNEHPNGNGVPPDHTLNNCPHCHGPAYPNLEETEKRWRAVFDSNWFQQYVSRYERGWYQIEPRSYDPRLLLLTTDRNFGTRSVYDWLEEYINNQQSTVAEAKHRIWKRYRSARTRLNDRHGNRLPNRLISYIWKDWYKDLIEDFYNEDLYLFGNQPHFHNPYWFDRVLYYHDSDQPIAAGHPQYRLLPQYRPPFAADVYLRNCGFSRINLIIHNLNAPPWARFRRMFERPENEWPASW